MNLLCVDHHVSELYMFGSGTRSDFDSKNSDLDFVVRFSDKVSVEAYARNFFSLQFGLEAIFKRKIDLLTVKEIKNPILLEEVESSKVLMYAA
ncbi:MAG: nucleotidyltransferase family protein [Luteibaculum sp.]